MHSILNTFSETAALLNARGWAERNAGNISFLMDEMPLLKGNWEETDFPLPAAFPILNGRFFAISVAGARMRDMMKEPERFILFLGIIAEGTRAHIYRLHGPSPGSPTSELLTHLYVHSTLQELRPEQKALVHAHVDPLIQLSHLPGIDSEEGLNGILLRMHPETVYFLPEGAGLVPLSMPGSIDLARQTAVKFRSKDVVIWERHGALACGPDLIEAFDRLDIAARAASLFLGCKNAGFSPKGITDEEMIALKNHYKLGS